MNLRRTPAGAAPRLALRDQLWLRDAFGARGSAQLRPSTWDDEGKCGIDVFTEHGVERWQIRRVQ